MKKPTDDDFVGMAPCVQCDSFPEPEPWYATEDPDILIHATVNLLKPKEIAYHKITRKKFNIMRPVEPR